MPTILIPNYAVQFQRNISIPVVEDLSLPLPSGLRAQLTPGVDFKFTIDDAIQAADRFLAINGTPQNPTQLVDEWVNILRWEIHTYWESLKGDWYGVQKNGPFHFSSEHSKRSGEYLAQGLAILFLEKRMQLSRSRFFFLQGTSARPDFIAYVQRGAQRAVLLKNRRTIGLEVRSRSKISSVPRRDKPQLKKKKQALSNTLAVYCSYGEPSPINNSARTKLILADPPGDDQIASDSDVARILLGHYLGVMGRLGLWGHRDLLREQLSNPSADFHRPSKRIKIPTLAIRESFNGQPYRGRFFSEMVLRATRGELSTAQVAHALKTGEFGRVFFSGIREDVLRDIGKLDWRHLEGFFDDRGIRGQESGTHFSTDGTIRAEQDSVSPKSVFGESIATFLRSFRRKG